MLFGDEDGYSYLNTEPAGDWGELPDARRFSTYAEAANTLASMQGIGQADERAVVIEE